MTPATTRRRRLVIPQLLSRCDSLSSSPSSGRNSPTSGSGGQFGSFSHALRSSSSRRTDKNSSSENRIPEQHAPSRRSASGKFFDSGKQFSSGKQPVSRPSPKTQRQTNTDENNVRLIYPQLLRALDDGRLPDSPSEEGSTELREMDSRLTKKDSDTLEYEPISELSDQEWRNIIEATAYGRLPNGFSLRSAGIIYDFDPKKKPLILSNTDWRAAIKQLVSFYRNMGGIRTALDRQLEREFLYQSMEEARRAVAESTWKTLNRRQRSDAIYEFCQTKMIEYELPADEFHKLLTKLSILFDKDQIKDKNVVYSNGQIERIDFVRIEAGKVVLDIKEGDQFYWTKKFKTANGSIFRSTDSTKQGKYKGHPEEWNLLTERMAIRLHTTHRAPEAVSSWIPPKIPQRNVFNALLRPHPELEIIEPDSTRSSETGSERSSSVRSSGRSTSMGNKPDDRPRFPSHRLVSPVAGS